jgi:disulfide bond formation protein DsbB
VIGRASTLLVGIILLALAAVGAALVSQHVLDMMPCAWCVLQRLIFLAAAAAALLGLLLPGRIGTRIGAMLVLAMCGCGIAAALWLHFVAGESKSCAMSLADRVMGATGLDSRWPEVFAAYASCGDARVSLLGLPYEFWSLGLFALLALLALRVVIRPR